MKYEAMAKNRRKAHEFYRKLIISVIRMEMEEMRGKHERESRLQR